MCQTSRLSLRVNFSPSAIHTQAIGSYSFFVGTKAVLLLQGRVKFIAPVLKSKQKKSKSKLSTLLRTSLTWFFDSQNLKSIISLFCRSQSVANYSTISSFTRHGFSVILLLPCWSSGISISSNSRCVTLNSTFSSFYFS